MDNVEVWACFHLGKTFKAGSVKGALQIAALYFLAFQYWNQTATMLLIKRSPISMTNVGGLGRE